MLKIIRPPSTCMLHQNRTFVPRARIPSMMIRDRKSFDRPAYSNCSLARTTPFSLFERISMERGNGGSPYRENTVRDIISSGKLPSLVSRGGRIFRHGDVRNASYCSRLMTRDVKRRFEVPPGFHRNVDAFEDV